MAAEGTIRRPIWPRADSYRTQCASGANVTLGAGAPAFIPLRINRPPANRGPILLPSKASWSTDEGVPGQTLDQVPHRLEVKPLSVPLIVTVARPLKRKSLAMIPPSCPVKLRRRAQ
jgi:hypothetical protein